jgi:para-aminobenzoate synthetase component 1
MTKALHLDEIPYCPDSGEVYQRIRELPYAALLDSSYPHTTSGRYDILTAAPEKSGLPSLQPGSTTSQCQEYFNELSRFHQEHYGGIQPASQDIPFCGGILGYIGYDCGNNLHGISRADEAARGPARLHAYDWAVVQDHLLRRAVLVALPCVSAAQRRDLLSRLRRPTAGASGRFALTEAFSSNFEVEEYRQAFASIQAYIQAGDCYQVNLAQRFSASYSGDPWYAYRALRGVAAAPFAAYLASTEGNALISLSPERFISLHGHHVETSPIKGTRPRYSDPRADQLAAEELRSSDKDRAENLMIVDLLRNDLGRSCIPGSIHVDRLFEVQSFPTVHHLVSTISGELHSDRGPGELLRDSFPGGSITGAPKRRAMEIIAELEPHARQAYCGSIMYISADGRMDSNIAIRSLLCDSGTIHCWGGGGIVADSQWQQEYQEIYDKVGKFLNVLESLHAE